ncbi:DUF4232 domain-containing protein [Streptomyces sp. 900116325]
MLTNRTSGACQVSGYPGLSLLDVGGKQIGAPATRDRRTYAPVVLEPGGSASVTIHTINRQGECLPTSARLRVYPPGRHRLAGDLASRPRSVEGRSGGRRWSRAAANEVRGRAQSGWHVCASPACRAVTECVGVPASAAQGTLTAPRTVYQLPSLPTHLMTREVTVPPWYDSQGVGAAFGMIRCGTVWCVRPRRSRTRR